MVESSAVRVVVTTICGRHASCESVQRYTQRNLVQTGKSWPTCLVSKTLEAVRQLRTRSSPGTVTSQDSVEPALSLVPHM
jgi:hypothetical protein